MVKAEKAWAWQTSSHSVLGRLFGCCCCLTAFRNPCVTRNHVACSSSEQEWAEHWTTFAVPEEYKHLYLLSVLPVLPIDVAFVQESSSYRSPVLKKGQTCRCQPVTTVREPFSSQFSFLQRVGRSMNSVYFSNVEFWKSLSLADTSDLVFGRASCWCCCVTGFQESYCYQPYQRPGITLPFPVREWAEHRTTLAMLEEQTLVLVQCLASLANWWGIGAAIQFTSITSTKHRAHVQVSAPSQ